jgi:hypothetical protein
MEAPFWSRASKSNTMHLFTYNLANAEGKMRAKCGRHAKPVGRKKKNDPSAAVMCVSCRHNRLAQERREKYGH